MRLCSHVVKDDTGFAPNPFHGYCTEAVCTPSHMRAGLKEGEWLIGNSPNSSKLPKEDRNRLVYAMRISEVLCMNKYFHDERFAPKKPKPIGEIEEQCGDNIYYQDEDATWKRVPSRFHNDRGDFTKDVGTDHRGRPVFVSDYFYYFGDKRVEIPEDFATVIHYGQGIHYTRDHQLANGFVKWLEDKYKNKPDTRGKPRDLKDWAAETGTMITDLIADCAGQAQKQERADCPPKSQTISETRLTPRGCR
jgi:Nucleotide modification associated domain 2